MAHLLYVIDGIVEVKGVDDVIMIADELESLVAVEIVEGLFFGETEVVGKHLDEHHEVVELFYSEFLVEPSINFVAER